MNSQASVMFLNGLANLYKVRMAGNISKRFLHFMMLRQYVLYPASFRASKFSDPVIYQDLVLTLDDLRKKIENLSTAKGLRKICNRLKWPIDGPDTHKLFQTFQRHTQIFHFALTVEGVSMLSQASGKVSEVLRVSQRYVFSRSFLGANYKWPLLLASPSICTSLGQIPELMTQSSSVQSTGC